MFQNKYVRTIEINSDEEALEESQAAINRFLENNPISFRRERDPEQSAKAALDAKSEIVSLTESSETVFVIAGLGKALVPVQPRKSQRLSVNEGHL